jgi:very-short-patch-repair endonuclease
MPEDMHSGARKGPQTAGPPDAVVRNLAASQHGVVTWAQLLEAGLPRKMVRVRAGRGTLLRLHRGVYAVGHRQLRREGHWLAAVLAVPGGVLSHRDAAGLHGLRPANHVRTDVTTTRRAKTTPGIAIHRTQVLDADDVTTVEGIPVTTVARTLVDLANVVPTDQLAKAMRTADELRTLDVRAVHDVLSRTAGRRGPGHQATRAALAEFEALATTLTRSSLEVSFQRLVQRTHLPKPQTNVFIDAYMVDAVWPDARLIVELDGWEYHRSRRDFQRDRERDAHLTTRGWTVLRFTHDHVVRRSAWVAGTIRPLLAAR